MELDRQLFTMIELEGRRYGGFFAQLDARGEGSLPRAAAVAFFAKSALSDAQVAELYARVKSVGVLADPERVSAAEFVMAMHLIVCLTKRGLARVPLPFPTYLFPSLDLTPETKQDDDVWSAATTPSASGFSAFPSPAPSPSSVAAGFAAMNMDGSNDSYHDTPKLRMEDLSTSSSSLSAALPGAKLLDARSLVELVHAETRNRKSELASLASLEHSENRTLQSLHSCLEQIASQVDALGFPVPSSSRTLDALDDLNNLFTKHVHAVKQEIQSMEISAQMMSVASERTESLSGIKPKRSDPLKEAATLTEELVRLQQQVKQLYTRRDALEVQVEAAAATTTAANSASSPQVSSVSTATPIVTVSTAPAVEAFSSLTQSGHSSGTDVFSSATVTSGANVVDPWGALSPPSSSTAAVKVDAVQNGSTPTPTINPSPASTNAFDDWGTFSNSTPSEKHESASTNPAASADPFDFGSPVAAASPSPATNQTTAPANDDFGWGSFQ